MFGNTEFFVSMGLPRPEDDRYFSLGTPSDPVFAVFAEESGLVQGRGNRLVLRDPAQLDTDWAAVQARKGKVGETLECPHCQRKLSKLEVPDDPCIDWPNDYLYLCFVEEDAAGRFRSAIEKGLPDFSGLPQVKEYGPKLGGPRG